jgi:diguanylate cyclase (GGDEF)-like protein/PAS domain S-box-containing protein
MNTKDSSLAQAKKGTPKRGKPGFGDVRLSAFVGFCDDAVAILTPEGIITDWNKIAERISGYKKSAVLGLPVWHLAPDNMRKEVLGIIDLVRKGEIIKNLDLPGTTKDGKFFHILLNAFPVVDRRGGLIGIAAIARDVTEIKKILADQDRDLSFLANVEEACYELDLNGKCTFCNEPAHLMFGYTREEYMNLRPRQRFASPEECNRVVQIFKNIYYSETRLHFFESEMMCKDGSLIIVELSISLMKDAQGNPVGFRGIGRNVTARKKAQAELESYRDFLENINDACFETDLRGKITFANEAAARRSGVTPQEMIGDNYSRYTANAEDIKRIYKIFHEIYLTGKPNVISDLEVYNRRGQSRSVEMSVSLIRNAGGNPTGFRIISRDITERKKAQEKLRESEERYHSIFDYNQAPMFLIDPETARIVDANRAASFYYGYSKDDLLNKKITDINTPDGEDVQKAMANVAAKSHNHFFFSHRLADGSVRPVEVFSGPVQIGGRNLLYSIIHDVSERRAAEEALRQSEEKYRTILDNIAEGYLELDLAGNISFVNDAACSIIGYSREEMNGMNYHKLVNEQTAAAMYEIYHRIYTTGISETLLDFEIIHRNGSSVIVELNILLMRNEEGNPIGFRVVSRDVTLRRKAEKDLRESEELYRTALESTNDGVSIIQGGKYVYANQKLLNTFGRPEENIIGTPYGRFVHPDDAASVVASYKNKPKGAPVPTNYVSRLLRPDGSVIYVEISAAKIIYQGKPAILSFLVDITRRKRAEEALRESEERRRLIFHNIPVPTFVWKAHNETSILTEFNRAALDFASSDIVNCIGVTSDEYFADRPEISAEIRRCFLSQTCVENNFWYRLKNGGHEEKYVTVKYAYSPPDSVLMHVNDMTAQKKAEENLQYISIHDSLTGLYNRFYADAEIDRISTGRLRPVSFIVIDLNDLKAINDRFGHAAGDLYIRKTAGLLKQTFRPEDMIARMGGDEFIIALPAVDENTCALALTRLKENLGRFNRETDQPINLAAGFSTAQAGDNVQEKIVDADRRMYQEKVRIKAAATTEIMPIAISDAGHSGNA